METEDHFAHCQKTSMSVYEQLDLGNSVAVKKEIESLMYLVKEIDFSAELEEYMISILHNTCAALIDGGYYCKYLDSLDLAVKLYSDNKEKLLNVMDEFEYFYTLGNALSNKNNLSPMEDNIFTIKEKHEEKTAYWNAYQASNTSNYRLLTNLGNVLSRQHRIIEAIDFHDKALNENPLCWEARLGRTHALLKFNSMTQSYSLEFIKQIRDGYKNLLENPTLPRWLLDEAQAEFEYFNEQYLKALDSGEEVYDEEEDKRLIQEEIGELSDYRKFCLFNKLSLSEHSVYCICGASETDDLTIPNRLGGMGNIVENEFILNRLKSEYSFARRMYYEYCHSDSEEEKSMFIESNFAELHDGELLGLKIEKLKSSYKQCFSILDKIANAICEEFGLYPNNDNERIGVMFNSFWRLDLRKERLEKNNYKGLSALYSIACDINDNKSLMGGLHHLKSHRNKIEHNFFSIFKNKDEMESALYKKEFTSNIAPLTLDEFEHNTLLILQLTRSAIFSYTYAVREKSEHLGRIFRNVKDTKPRMYDSKKTN